MKSKGFVIILVLIGMAGAAVWVLQATVLGGTWRSMVFAVNEEEGEAVTEGAPLGPADSVGEPSKIDFTMIRGANYTPGKVIIPDALKKYDNKRVQIIGFMVPFYRIEKLKEFTFLRQPAHCYFCAAPGLDEIILVKMKEGYRTRFSDYPVRVTGIFKIDVKVKNGKAISLFEIIADNVEEKR